MDGLPDLPWATIGPWGLVAGAVISVLTGRLIPYPTWQAWLTAWNERLTAAQAENAKLHGIVEQQALILDVYNSQLKQLLEGQKATETLLASLHAKGVAWRAVVEAKDQTGAL